MNPNLNSGLRTLNREGGRARARARIGGEECVRMTRMHTQTCCLRVYTKARVGERERTNLLRHRHHFCSRL